MSQKEHIAPNVVEAEVQPPPADDTVTTGDTDYPAVTSLKQAKVIFWSETVNTWRIAGPVVFQIVCQYGINSITNIVAGHIGELELSAVAISVSVFATFAFGFLYGMASASETLCGQAFGAGQLHMLGVYLQRSSIIMFLCCLLILPLYVFATPILRLLGQHHDVAHLAGKFTILCIPQLFSSVLSFPVQKFLQAQSKVNVLAWTWLVGLFLHTGMLCLFIYKFKWGITGAAVALNVTNWAITVAQAVYAIGWCKETWGGLSMLAWKGLWAFARLSIASAVMLSLEIWYMMTILILTGHLHNPVLAVDSLSICLNLNGWENIIFIGVSAAMSVRVSNELGRSHPRRAKFSVFVTVAESLILGLIFMVIVIIVKDYFAVIFTSSKQVQRAVSRLAYFLAITMVLNSVQPVISGVAIGGGWQALVAYINLACYYLFGLPLGIVLGYRLRLGVKGLWLGMIAGTAMQTLLLLMVVYRTNWSKEVEQTAKRLGKWAGEGTVPSDIALSNGSTEKTEAKR